MKSGYLLTALMASFAIAPSVTSAQVSVGISVRLAPPPLPIYAQPPLPGAGYLWTPGYWAWDDIADAYYWVAGTWVLAPRPGLLWTPPWWGWSDGVYVFHTGYWAPHVGFYGGIAYGFGYTGFGYQGGYWNGGRLFYNQTVNNITNVNITNIYRRDVTVNHINRVSYNNGPGGIRAQPTLDDQQAMHEQHVAPTTPQQRSVQAARMNPRSFAAANRENPQQRGYGASDHKGNVAEGRRGNPVRLQGAGPGTLPTPDNVAHLSRDNTPHILNDAGYPDNNGDGTRSVTAPRHDAQFNDLNSPEQARRKNTNGRVGTPLPPNVAHQHPFPDQRPIHGPTPQKHTAHRQHDERPHG